MLLGPYFAHMGREHPYIGYICGCFFYWLLMSMLNVQNLLENPFISHGKRGAEDDINLDNLRGAQSPVCLRECRRGCGCVSSRARHDSLFFLGGGQGGTHSELCFMFKLGTC